MAKPATKPHATGLAQPAPRTVLVTGVTSGFGSAIARQYIAAGMRVVGAGRREARLAALRQQLGARFHPLMVDVGDAAAVSNALARLPKRFSDIAILVNNAGLAQGNGRAPEIKLEDWELMVRTNISGVLNVTNAVLPGMVARDFGDIVNIGSIAGNWPYPGGNVYGATKAFIRQFTLNLRADLLGRNVRAICIEPGTARTEFAAVRLKSAAAAKDFYAQPNLLEAQDIAEIVNFCTSLPRHVNINSLEVMGLGQAFAFPAFASQMAPLGGPGRRKSALAQSGRRKPLPEGLEKSPKGPARRRR